MADARRLGGVVGLLAAMALALSSCGERGDAPDGACAGLDVTITGTHRADHLRGTPGRDVIWGGRGNDRIEGLGGDDVLCGGPGADRLSGGAGDDVVDGGDDLRFAVDTDSYEWQGDVLAGGPGDDTMVTGPHAGHVAVDEVTYAASGSGVEVDLATGSASGEGRDRIKGVVRTLVGSRHDDRLLGSAHGEAISGGRGSDHVDGREGDDSIDAAGSPAVETAADEARDTSPNWLTGGPGDDEIKGAEGDDVLDGGPGDDSMSGGLGIDRILGGDGRDSISDFVAPVDARGAGRQVLDGGAGADAVVGLDLVRPHPVGDETTFADGAGTLDLAEGRLRGRVGQIRYDEVVRSFADTTTPYGTWTVIGTDGPNEIIGNDEKRPVTIHAGAGDDRLFGSFAADLLDGGPGVDVAYGYAGHDRYVAVEKVHPG